MLAGPLYSAVAKLLRVAAELIPREQAGEFRYCGTELVCVNQYHPTECGLLLQTAGGRPPRNMMGLVFMAHDVGGIADSRGRQP